MRDLFIADQLTPPINRSTHETTQKFEHLKIGKSILPLLIQKESPPL